MQAIAVTNLTTTPTPLACIPSGGATTHRPSHSVTAVASRPPPTSPHQQITHSMQREKVELFKSLEPWASKNVLPLLKPVETCWQPNDFLPDSTKPVNDFVDEVRALRDLAKGLSDEYLVVLVGDMISEDAVPTYQTMFNITDAIRDETASSPSPWATLTRAWTAEENRHGDLLRTYLYLSGRVDMSMVERTVQYLIGAGMDPGLENNPYLVYVYTSFQERVAFISHCNKARLAKEGGDPILANICGTIADDESHHENAFIKIIEKLLEVDPNETMLAIGKMLRKKIRMPAHLMYDGRDPHLFEHFGLLAHKIGVYTTNDYADILEYLIGRWRLEKVEGLTGDARREQEFVCSLAPGIRKVQAQEDERAKEGLQRMKISWIFNREVTI